MARAPSLLESIIRARKSTHYLLDGTSPADWFWMPREGVSHIAWQVGHLAFAQYGLALERVRGSRPDDEGLLPTAFREKFGRGSTPVGDAAAYPTVAEIRRVWRPCIDRCSRSFQHSTTPYSINRRPNRIPASRPRVARWPGVPSTR
jgi:hypothetical protein